MTKPHFTPSLLDQISPRKLSKGERTRLHLVQSSIQCFATHGFEASTFDKIASHSKLSRPLVTHYYPRKELLIEACFKMIAANAQNYIESHTAITSKVTSILSSYIDVNFEWAKEFPEHFKVFLMFVSQCSFDKASREFNTQAKEVARIRILQWLELGIKNNEFTVDNPGQVAKIIHNALYSEIISYYTENTNQELKSGSTKSLLKKLLNLK